MSAGSGPAPDNNLSQRGNALNADPGCACRVLPNASNRSTGWLGLALSALLLTRRRRTTRGS
jgi:MYXO-CTERM domain-containing protein